MDADEVWAEVAALVDRADPEGLLEMGAPADEYHPEIEDLTALVLAGEATDDAVRTVWERWFGPGSAAVRRPAGELRAIPASPPAPTWPLTDVGRLSVARTSFAG